MLAPTTEQKASPTFTRVQTQHTGCCVNGQSCSPTHEAIERRAYEIYVANGRTEGRGDQDWQLAELQLAVNEGVVPIDGTHLKTASR